MICKIRDFIASWEGFGGIPFPVDLLGPLPGCGAVMPRGEEILRRQEDIRGRVALRKRLTVHVLLAPALQQDGWQPHQLLLDFGSWALGHVPQLGADTRLVLRGPELVSRGDDDLGRYRMELAFEFTEFLEKEQENG